MGPDKPWECADSVGHLWRTTGDTYDSHDGQAGWSVGCKRILDLLHPLVEGSGPDGIAKFSGPGHWNVPDMPEVGKEGLSLAESRAHFSFSCMLAAPLMAGNDVRRMTAEVRGVLTNRDVLAIDPDAPGKGGARWPAREKHRNLGQPAGQRRMGGCALNTGQPAADHTVHWNRLWTIPGKFRVHYVWANRAADDNTKPSTARSRLLMRNSGLGGARFSSEGQRISLTFEGGGRIV